jgi:L-aminopeptidase/D-esterase-like protein
MAALTQLFYTNNWLHDAFYDAGFNEAAGNAQQDDFGRGGLGGGIGNSNALFGESAG